jgi:hypothetical protein
VDTEEKRDAMDRNLRYLQPGLKEFDAYYFLHYKTYSNKVVSLGKQMRFWKEVLPALAD